MLRRYYRAFHWFLQHYAWHYVIGCTAMLLSYYLSLLAPRMVGQMADRIIAGTVTGAELWPKLGGLLLLILLNYGMGYVYGLKIFGASDEICRLGHIRFYQKLLRQGPQFFRRHSSGSLMGKATNDVEELGEFAGWGIVSIFDAIFWPLALIGFMAMISWRMTLLALLPLPILIIFSTKVGKIIFDLYDQRQQAFDKMNEAVLEGVRGVRLVRAYGLEASQAEAFRQHAQNQNDKDMRFAKFQLLYGPMGKLIPGISFVLTLILAFFEIRAGRLTTGDFLSFSFYMNLLAWPMMAVGEFINQGQTGYASMLRVQEIWDSPEEERERPLDFPENPGLDIEDLSFTYPDAEQPALEHLTVNLAPGSSLGIVGPVGSGKTTFLKQILDFYEPDSGAIYWSGRPQRQLDRKLLRQNLAYVAQEPFLFSKTVRDNVLLGAPDRLLAEGPEAQEAALQRVLQEADFLKDVEQLPEGLASEAGEKGIALSGGQKQRLCLARALIKGAPVLLLDDCLSAVDAVTERNILAALKARKGNGLDLIVAHRLSAVMDCDQIIVLEHGRVSERGTHAELLAKGGWYAEQYERQHGAPETAAALDETPPFKRADEEVGE